VLPVDLVVFFVSLAVVALSDDEFVGFNRDSAIVVVKSDLDCEAVGVLVLWSQRLGPSLL